MLVIDGYGLHLTIEFVEYCYQLDVKISMFLLLAHSTHLCYSHMLFKRPKDAMGREAIIGRNLG
jgi:hypothetical protein